MALLSGTASSLAVEGSVSAMVACLPTLNDENYHYHLLKKMALMMSRRDARKAKARLISGTPPPTYKPASKRTTYFR